VFNPLIGKLSQRIGFRAIYLSGASLSASLGLPDIGLLTLTEVADFARCVTSACSLPLLCDADTGFGEAVNAARTVQLFEMAGAAGIHLEDQELPKRCGHLPDKQLVPTEVMVDKIKSAVQARRDSQFVILARTDARAVQGFEAAVERAERYLEAGADGIFPEALQSPEEFAQFARQIRAPLLANMTEFGKSPSLSFAELTEMGYRMVIYPVTTLRIALRSAERVLHEIRDHGRQERLVPEMMTRQELYDLLEYQVVTRSPT
jgi:methylisocitrate lyase